MAHFAYVENGFVTKVLVIEQDKIDTGLFGDPKKFIQTSHNTHGGIYYTPNTNKPDPDQSKALRKNYAGVGYFYESRRDAFIPPQPYNSWVLNDDTCLWDPPKPYPEDNEQYEWNEEQCNWVKI